MNLIDRFISYVKIDTQSDENSDQTPSTSKQFNLAKELERELNDIGLSEISLDNNCYLMATLPANTHKKVPTIGFIAHLDTSPDMSGQNVKPRIVKNYDGNDIILNEVSNIVLSPNDFPELLNHKGEDLIVTDGNTLLGADDKAGVAEIMTAIEYLLDHPEIKHGKIRIGFTPDEEIGRGPDKFDVEKFGAKWAYTMDGGEIGELEYENFNAASAKISIQGRNVHPGYAKNKMINALHIANELVSMLPANERPEYTEGYEGFFHLTSIQGTVDEATVSYIIRDHDRTKFENRKKQMVNAVNFLNTIYDHRIKLELKDQYYNMREKIEPVPHVIDYAFRAMQEVGVTPIVRPIRGGTDGARLSFMGLPCPNIFAGGLNFHGRYEFIPIPSMYKAVDVIVKIAELVEKDCK
ncbi:peptidase T [Seramator thermalis]|jgi:tripeptide aminopeptidase|uniref:peptidase T n=1 Tax=Seramator thermalis TaxID=2496270 RepID=UPI0009D5D97B|nr:peptidase T [Seramator thermalis]MBP9031225.1 peptidase T [Dysgonamonadaceae bacterium]MDK2969783.1 tripeptide aminopeptidase [Bacteroidota bacterium]OPZ15075.1 MAG: Peptidase T [Bacteroidetes bacterium ADurb.BinA261]MBZ4674943.1 peptidase [Dysgonamonadaceae bacterium]HOT63983.1 peptidase T [Dysgonamonadaceae bacterium]